MYTYLFISICFFFFNDTATTEIYPLSLHDALPISPTSPCRSNSNGERIIANGVLNSCVMLANNCDLNRSFCLSCSCAVSRLAFVSSSAIWCTCCSRCQLKVKICPVPTTSAVEQRKNRLEIDSTTLGGRPAKSRLASTNEATIRVWVASTTCGGQTKRRPVPTMTRE